MEIFTKDIKSMEDLLIHGLPDIYSPATDHQIASQDDRKGDQPVLVTGLKGHLDETTTGRAASDGVREARQAAPAAQCPAIDGIIREADENAGRDRR